MFLDNYISQINYLCRQNSVKTLYAFGSVLSDRFTADSDIDLIIDIDSNDPIDYSEKYFNVSFGLQDLIKRPIDLLEEKTIRNKYLRAELDKTKTLIYGW